LLPELYCIAPTSQGHRTRSALYKQQSVVINMHEAVHSFLAGVQMVDRLDQGALPRQDFSNSYTSLYKLVQKALYRTHVEGQLKGDIIQDPASYVELDPDMAKTLMDQRQAVCLF